MLTSCPFLPVQVISDLQAKHQQLCGNCFSDPSLLRAGEKPSALLPRIPCRWRSGCELHTLTRGLDSFLLAILVSHDSFSMIRDYLCGTEKQIWCDSKDSFCVLARWGVARCEREGLGWRGELQLNTMESKSLWLWQSWLSP